MVGAEVGAEDVLGGVVAWCADGSGQVGRTKQHTRDKNGGQKKEEKEMTHALGLIIDAKE